MVFLEGLVHKRDERLGKRRRRWKESMWGGAEVEFAGADA
jgi:hypothetical protein